MATMNLSPYRKAIAALIIAVGLLVRAGLAEGNWIPDEAVWSAVAAVAVFWIPNRNMDG